MPESELMAAAFERLAALFAPYRDDLVAKADEPGHLSLDAPPSPSYPKGLFFGAVKIGKRNVSFHLMPVDAHPKLLDSINPELRQRMRGKSCFTFTAPDDALFVTWGGSPRPDFIVTSATVSWPLRTQSIAPRNAPTAIVAQSTSTKTRPASSSRNGPTTSIGRDEVARISRQVMPSLGLSRVCGTSWRTFSRLAP
jgi:hypothetical protein